MYSKVTGEVRSQKIITPKNPDKKTYIQLQLLQTSDGQEDKLVQVRDYDLNRKYNGKFDAMCTSMAIGNGFLLTIRLKDDPK